MKNREMEYLKQYERVFIINPSEEARRLADRFDFLPYMVERYLKMFRDKVEVEDYLYNCNFPLIKSIRCNTLRVDCNYLEERMKNKGFVMEKISWLNHGYKLLKAPLKPSLGSTMEYLLGFYRIQGLASMVPAYVLNPNESDIVLDMAAAPGGKTTQLSQLMNNKGLIVAVEKRRDRVKSLISNINRLGAENVLIVRTDVRNLVKMKTRFSKILLDAPCSGEGLIQKDPVRKFKTKVDDLKEFALLQLGLINTAYDLLGEKGRLVYSTCSVAPEEDELIVNFAVDQLGLKVVKITNFPASNGYIEYGNVKFNESLKHCLRFFPHIHGTEGFFVCLLEKE